MIVGILLLLACVILTALSIVWEFNNGNSGSNTLIGFLAGGLFTVGIAIILSITDPEPKAMDVYQGNTALKYTIVNEEVIDSIVVWKPEYKKN